MVSMISNLEVVKVANSSNILLMWQNPAIQCAWG